MSNCKNDTKDTKIGNAQIKSNSLQNADFGNVSNEPLNWYTKEKNLITSNEVIAEKIKNIPVYQTTPLPQSTIVNIGKASAIGRRMLMVDKANYGPSVAQRNNGENIITDAQSGIDSFRIISAKYWTISSDSKSIIYLKDAGGIKHNIVNYNFAPVENLNFVLQQWLLISPKKDDFLIEVNKPILVSKSVVNNANESQTSINTRNNINSKFQTGFSELSIGSPTKSNSINTNKIMNMDSVKNTNFSQMSEYSISQIQNSIKGYEYSPELWKLYVNGGISSDGKMYSPLFVLNKDFYDYSFELSIPFMKKEVDTNALLSSPLIANCEFIYSFYMKEYEKNIINVPEKVLPNFYIFETEMSREENNKEFLRMITLDGILDVKDAIIVPPSKNMNNEEMNKNYFNSLATGVKSVIDGGLENSENRKKIDSLSLIDRIQTNIGIPIDNLDILKKFDDYKVMFPMYVDLQFSTDKTTIVSDILYDCSLDKELIKDVMSGNENLYSKRDFIEDIEVMIQENNTLVKSVSSNNVNRKVWDITDWITNVKEKEITINNGLILYKNKDTGREQDSEIIKNLFRIIFVGKIKKLIKDKFRTFEETLNGKLAYSESVMYKIEKSLADANGNKNGDVLQTYYVSNGNEIDMLKLIDTQVKYGIRYRYDVFVLQLVVGTKYKYVNKAVSDESTAVMVEQEPRVVLVEVPYCSFSDIMLDFPPVRPDVEIIPYKGIDNKLLFFFNGNIGDYVEMPIAINSEDKIRIDEYKKAKKIKFNEPIRFKSDDHASIFQVFRTEVKPKSYSDFSGKLIATIQTDISPLTAQSATSAAYIDRIKPNINYWYCFRSIDNHGHLSQPTDIFQVEIVNDHGMVYPIIQTFDMEKEKENKLFSKPMKRYVYIAPTLLQKLVNEDKSGLNDLDSVKDYDPKKIYLGVNDKTMWGNNYKIRITSKKTGKNIDINVIANYNGIRKEKNVI